MPGPVDNVPTFNKGERLAAAKLNALGGMVARTIGGPGSFQSGAHSVQRKIGGIAGPSGAWALVRATGVIIGGTGDPRVPETSGSYEHIKGAEVEGDIENWATVSIDDNAYMFVVYFPEDESWVIVQAFC